MRRYTVKEIENKQYVKKCIIYKMCAQNFVCN